MEWKKYARWLVLASLRNRDLDCFGRLPLCNGSGGYPLKLSQNIDQVKERRMRTRLLNGLGVLGLLILVLCGSSGCVRFAANVFQAFGYNERPAEYEGFAKQRVAVVCVTDKGLSADDSAKMLTAYVHVALNMNIKDIKLVRQEEVSSGWMSTGHWKAITLRSAKA